MKRRHKCEGDEATAKPCPVVQNAMADIYIIYILYIDIYAFAICEPE